MAEHTVVIPPEVEYTKALFCQVDPPHDYMSVSFTKEGEAKPFRVGKIVGRRCPEIAAYMFRPNRIEEGATERAKPLEAGDKINVKVTLYKSGNPDTRELTEELESHEGTVEVT